MVLKDNYGCYNCEHFQKEKLTEDCKWVGFCSLDPKLQKKHFVGIDNKQCQDYLPGIAISIYNSIKNGVSTKESLKKEYNFSDLELNEILEILIKQNYIVSIDQCGITYYLS